MTVRMVAMSFDGNDANPGTVRAILGATCQVAVPPGERTDRLAMLIEDQTGAKKVAIAAAPGNNSDHK